MTWNDPVTRNTGDLITAAIWNQDVVDNVDYLHSRVGRLFIPPSRGQNSFYQIDSYTRGYSYQNSETNSTFVGGMFFSIPDDFDTLVSARVIVAPQNAVTVEMDVFARYAAEGEAIDNHIGALANLQQAAVFPKELLVFDVSALLVSLAANDYGTVLVAASSATSSHVGVLGLLIEYTRS